MVYKQFIILPKHVCRTYLACEITHFFRNRQLFRRILRNLEWAKDFKDFKVIKVFKVFKVVKDVKDLKDPNTLPAKNGGRFLFRRPTKNLVTTVSLYFF